MFDKLPNWVLMIDNLLVYPMNWSALLDSIYIFLNVLRYIKK